MEIDLTKLTRDYKEKPLTPHEQICKEDLEYLYLECNLTYQQIAPIFNRKGTAIANRCKKLGLIKSKEQHKLSVENYYMDKYGVKNPAQLQSSKEKAKQTSLKKYGVDNIAKLDKTVQKRKKTCLEKYGVDNPAKAQEIKDKTKLNNLEKYGVDYPTKLEEIADKRKQTLLENYGVEVPLKSSKIKDKMKKTNLERYGVENVFQVPEFRKEHRNRLKEKYGVDNVAKLPETRRKMYETQKTNGSFGTSKEEEKIYKLLLDIFPLTERQYSTDFYPYPCDFYIPELDLWIEYQKFKGHNQCAYNPNNIEHVKKVEYWKRKAEEINFKGQSKDMYLAFIDTWTRKDPHKRQIAKDNKLNWIEFFNMEQFMEWYKQICENLI